MKNKSLALSLLIAQCFAQAADIEVRPPVNGGFAIKSADGSVTRFKVEETGGVAVQNVLSGLNNQPLCWNPTTKYLEVCADAVGRDFTKPTISMSVPEVATAYEMNINVQYSDNVGLGSYTNGGQLINTFPDEVTNATIVQKIQTKLGDGPKTWTFAVTDSSGNLARRTFLVSPPSIGFIPSKYNIQPSVTVPQGFNCINPTEDMSAKIANNIDIYLVNSTGQVTSNWSIENGFYPMLNVNLQQGNMGLLFLRSYNPVAISSNGVTYEYNPPDQSGFGVVNGIATTYGIAHSISITPKSGVANAVDVSITQKCTVPRVGGTTSQGTPFFFTATLNQ